MKKCISVLLMLPFFLAAVCLADSSDTPAIPQNLNEQLPSAAGSEKAGVGSNEYLAEQKVKMLPSTHGKSIDSYLTNMTKIPMAEDLGWKVYTVEDGYEVERSILINNTKTLRYKWKVSNSGEVSPAGDKERSLMK